MFSPITLRDSYTQEMVENHIQRSKTGETQSETYVKGEQRISGDISIGSDLSRDIVK
jgi:hypothetical protein